MIKDTENIENIIEQYVELFRNLLITLLKNKSCDKMDISKNIKNKKKYNYCLHPNYKGNKCKRMVNYPGDLCVFHGKNNNKKDNKTNLDVNKNLFDNPLDENNDSLNDLNETSNKFNNKILDNIDKINNSSNVSLDKLDIPEKMEKLELLSTINIENNKLICRVCKKTLVTQQEINGNICNHCNNVPPLSRNKTLIKCKFCNNNTLSTNGVCNGCLNTSNNIDIKSDKTICPNCNLFKTENQKLCRKCYKKQKRKFNIYF